MIEWIFSRYIKRIWCVLFGCDIRWYSSAYMPDDYNSPDYCKRCGACHDVYGIETTDYDLLYPSETKLGSIMEWWRYG